MKPKPIILLLVGLFACGYIAWLVYSPTPTIRFIEIREDQKVPSGDRTTRVGRVAVFRITNDSRHPYSFFSYAPSWPFYTYRVPDPSDESGWNSISPRKWGRVADTIAPRTSMDVHVHINASDVQRSGDLSPSEYAESIARADREIHGPLEFAIGIRFERGTAAQLEARDASGHRDSGFFSWLRRRRDPGGLGPEPTWSSVAHTQ